jgi:addiction module HigA family antidote
MFRLENVHPGEVIREDFMRPRGISAQALALEAGIPLDRLNEVLDCRAPVDADIAIRLSAVLGVRERFWLGLQMDFDIEEAYRRRMSVAGGR